MDLVTFLRHLRMRFPAPAGHLGGDADGSLLGVHDVHPHTRLTTSAVVSVQLHRSPQPDRLSIASIEPAPATIRATTTRVTSRQVERGVYAERTCDVPAAALEPLPPVDALSYA
ncbi:hypothetical protein GCM10018771_24530 [Streptomyces cellulosae]|nr:hypothetical protein GCM10018771_24530 [Streptomyces cellulosae]